WGNCITCRFWTENWSTFSSLKHYLHNDSNFSLGIQEDATLSILYSCNQILPHARLDEHMQLHAYLTTIQLSMDDHYEWELEGKTNTRYSTGQVYGILSTKGLEVGSLSLNILFWLQRILLPYPIECKDKKVQWHVIPSNTTSNVQHNLKEEFSIASLDFSKEASKMIRSCFMLAIASTAHRRPNSSASAREKIEWKARRPVKQSFT
ncbi:hypothetical protein HID58_033036, partial [Brassica napus]